MEAILILLLPWLERIFTESNPARLAESLVVLFIAWWRVKAMMTQHLTKIEIALDNLSESVRAGSAAGEERFKQIETRVSKLENN